MKRPLINITAGAFVIKGYYDPGSPGRYSGPPENCYPAEPSTFEVDSVTWTRHHVDGTVIEQHLDPVEFELIADALDVFANTSLDEIALQYVEREREARGDYDGPDPDTYEDPSYDAYADYVNDRG